MICSFVRTQATSPWSADAVAAHVSTRRPGRTCSQRNRPSPLIRVTASMISGPSSSTEPPDLDLSVVGRDDEHRAGRQHLEHVADEPVDGPQLVVVVRAQPLGVGHLVDALVVGVDERGAGRRQLADRGDEPGRRVPAVQVHVAQVRGGEPGRPEVVARHDGHAARGARGTTRTAGTSAPARDIRASTPRSDHWSTFMTSPSRATR